MGTGSTGDEIDVGHLEELPEDELSAPVSVDEGGCDPLPGEILDGLGDVGPFNGDGVLDAGLQKVEDIGPSLDDDDRFGIADVGPGRASVFTIGRDLLDLDALPYAVREVDTGSLGLLDELVEQLLGTFDDLLPLGYPYIFDSENMDGRLARTDAIDGLESGSEYDGLHLVEAGRHVDDTLGLSALGGYLDLNPSDASGFLQVSQIELVSEESLGLAEDRAHDIGLLYHTVGVDLGFYHIFGCTRIDIHQHPPWGVREKHGIPALPTPSAPRRWHIKPSNEHCWVGAPLPIVLWCSVSCDRVMIVSVNRDVYAFPCRPNLWNHL